MHALAAGVARRSRALPACGARQFRPSSVYGVSRRLERGRDGRDDQRTHKPLVIAAGDAATQLEPVSTRRMRFCAPRPSASLVSCVRLASTSALAPVSRYRQQALRRPPSQSWHTFLRNHASSIWAADLFTVQTLAFRTLSVLIVIDHDRRRIRHWNVTEHPNAPWIWQQMIEATAWGQQPWFLIRDRDCSYGGDFIARARRIGIETILTPVHAPNANAIAERVIGTLRRECLDHVIAGQRTTSPAGAW